MNTLIMKRFFLPLAIMALFMTSCDDTDKPGKGSVNGTAGITLTYEFSDDYLNFYDVIVEGQDFDGKPLDIKVTSGKQTAKITTTKKPAESTIRVYTVKKNPLPEISKDAKYSFGKSFEAVFYVNNKQESGVVAVKNQSFTGGSSSSAVSGEKLIEKPELLDRETMVFDRAYTFKVCKDSDDKTIEIITVKD